VELHKGALCGAPRNIVTALTTTMADVSAGKTENTHMYAKSVAGVILRDCADNPFSISTIIYISSHIT
jgi:hypothetical protein